MYVLLWLIRAIEEPCWIAAVSVLQCSRTQNSTCIAPPAVQHGIEHALHIYIYMIEAKQWNGDGWIVQK